MEFDAKSLKSMRPLTGEGRKLYIETYGCQMNVNDSEVVLSIMQDAGYRYTEHLDEADVILINTCSVRDNAEQRQAGRYDERCEQQSDDGEEYALRLAHLACRLHADEALFLCCEQAHQRRLDDWYECHVRVCAYGDGSH